MRYFVGFVAAFVVLAIIGLFVMFTGAYDVAASSPHTAPVRWAINQTLEASIERQSDGLKAPEMTEDRLAEGAREYDEHCARCHGGPGVKADAWTRGMLPAPPSLSEVADEEGEELTTKEAFWVIKHGIKMTGMPAFGASAKDDELWSIAAFVSKLPDVSAEQYASIHKAEGGEEGEAGESGESGETSAPAGDADAD